MAKTKVCGRPNGGLCRETRLEFPNFRDLNFWPIWPKIGQVDHWAKVQHWPNWMNDLKKLAKLKEL